MTNSTILKYISVQSPAFRAGLARLCKIHSEKQCNGEYYENDQQTAWIGYTGAPLFEHSTANKQAKEGKRREESILKKMHQLVGLKELPNFLSYSGDPRGFVLKINSDKLTEEEIKLCASLGFMRDWGGDFAIVKDAEWQ